MWKQLRKHIITGLSTLLPLVVTIYVVYFLIKIVIKWISPLSKLLEKLIGTIPGNFKIFVDIGIELVSALIIFSFIILIGVLAETLFVKSFKSWIEGILSKISILNVVYKGIQQFLEIMFSEVKTQEFLKAVLVEFPKEGSWLIGFITNEVYINQEKYYTIFLPTTPNPATGYLILQSEQKIKELNIPPEEALKLVVSGGIVIKEDYANELLKIPEKNT